MTRHFCPTCGSHVYHSNLKVIRLGIQVGLMDRLADSSEANVYVKAADFVDPIDPDITAFE